MNEPDYELMVPELLEAGWKQEGELFSACAGVGATHMWKSPDGFLYVGRHAWLAMKGDHVVERRYTRQRAR